MVEGVRQHVREDLDAVYYFRTELDDNEDEAGWYLENSANHRRVSGPYSFFVVAKKAASTQPSNVRHLGTN